MSESTITTGEVLELLRQAQQVIANAHGWDSPGPHPTTTANWKLYATNWLEAYGRFQSRLINDHRELTRALGEAVDEAGKSDDPQAFEKLKRELAFIADSYAKRHVARISWSEPLTESPGIDTVDRIARVLFEVSSELGTGMPDAWEQAPPQIRSVIQETVAKLLAAGVIAPGLNGGYPEVEVTEQIALELQHAFAELQPGFGLPHFAVPAIGALLAQRVIAPDIGLLDPIQKARIEASDDE